MEKLIKERTLYLPMLVGQYVKTPSKNGGMWFSFGKDDAVTDEKLVEEQSIGIYLGDWSMSERLNPGETPSKYKKSIKSMVDFSYRSLNNGTEMFDPAEIIPIVKPLTSLTNNHCLEVAIADGYDEDMVRSRPEAVIQNIKAVFTWKPKELVLSPAMWGWLIRHGYDVFGWLEKNIALNYFQQKLPVQNARQN